MIRKKSTDLSSVLHQRSNLWKKCKTLKTLKQIHSRMIINGINSDTSSLRELVYASAVAVPHAIEYAHKVFDKITQPDIFMFNTMLRGSAQSSNPFLALTIYTQMEKVQKDSIFPDNCYTFPEKVQKGLILPENYTFSENVRKGLNFPDDYTFPEKVQKDLILPENYTFSEYVRKGLNVPDDYTFPEKVQKDLIFPDNYTFPFLLKACTKLGWAHTGRAVHGKIVRHGFVANTFARNTLIYFHANVGDMNIACDLFDEEARKEVVAWSALTAGYARRGQLAEARRLFDEMPVKDLVSWNVMITGYAKRGDMDSARELFGRVPKRDVVSWNAMISGYVLSGAYERAMETFEEMVGFGEKPDEVSMLSLLSACADSGDLKVGEKLHFSLSQMNKEDFSVVVGNALIDMYAKCGSIERAYEVFRGMREKDISSWNSIICGLALHGHSKEAVSLFEEMRRIKIRPNEVTFVGVLVAYTHVGDVKKGREYFTMMSERYGIVPNIKHYGCMVDLLGRAGKLEEAFEFIDEMEIEPNGIIWRTLLGACKTHGDVELGKRANEELLKLRRDHSGDYVLLSNIYASQGEWDGVESVRREMDESGVRKEVGCSLV